ncbi:MAG: S9 family peptidase [Bacteroidota bacterium]
MLQNLPNPPQATEIPKELTIHGDVRQDPYFWLNNPEDAAVIDYLNQENTYTESVLKPTENLQHELFEEMKGRIVADEKSVPYFNGKDWFYHRYETGGEYPLYCRKKGNLNAHEEILLHGNQLGKDESYFAVGGLALADNEQILAYATDTVSRRNYTVYFKNLLTGELLPDKIENTEGGSYAWSADSNYFFYLLRDPQTLLASKIFRHQIGTNSSTDVLVYEEKNEECYMSLSRSKSKEYIFSVSSQQGVYSEYRILKTNNPTGDFETFQLAERGLEYFIEHQSDRFLIRTNNQGATNFQLMECSVDGPKDKSQWKTVVAHRPDVFIEDFDATTNWIALEVKTNGLSQIQFIQGETNEFIRMDDAVFQVSIGTNVHYQSQTLRYNYTSLTCPNSVLEYDGSSQKSTLLKEDRVLGSFDKNEYQSERLWATARDGVKIPISLVYKKGYQKGPLLLYAYGSYGYSMDPYFSSSRLSLLNRGFAFAIAHIRGGQEMGRHWYEDGKMMRKMNTFTDFIDCGKQLVSMNKVDEKRLFAQGGSAGGMLMGGVINMAPTLFAGVIAAVPFVDVVTTMLDETIPLTTGEWEEWGNPKNEEHYHYMKSYSPYDNVIAQDYPHLFVTTGLHDSQVQYWEPAKWVAKLRKLKTDNRILLLDCDMSAGHGGASGRYKRFKDIAKDFAFLIGINETIAAQ